LPCRRQVSVVRYQVERNPKIPFSMWKSIAMDFFHESSRIQRWFPVSWVLSPWILSGAKPLRLSARSAQGYATDFGCYRLPWCDGRCVQGPGTYSPRHADPRLLAIPTSRRRVSACDPNW